MVADLGTSKASSTLTEMLKFGGALKVLSVQRLSQQRNRSGNDALMSAVAKGFGQKDLADLLKITPGEPEECTLYSLLGE